MMSYYEFIDLLHTDFCAAIDLSEDVPEYDAYLRHYFEEQERWEQEGWTDGDELQMQLNPPKLTDEEELPW